jgi:hypothetical protein
LREYPLSKNQPEKPKMVSKRFVHKFQRKKALLGAGGMSDLIHKVNLRPIAKANLIDA